MSSKILLFKIGAIGDVIMTTPFVRQIRTNLGHGAIIDYMVGHRSKPVLLENPHLSNIIWVEEDFMQKIDFSHFIRWIRFIWFIRSIRHQYDAVVLFDKHWIFSFTFWLAWYSVRIGFNRLWKEGWFLTKSVVWDATKREVEYYLDILKLLWYTPDYTNQFYEVLGGALRNNTYSWNNEILTSLVFCKSEIEAFFLSLKQSERKIIGIATGWGNAMSPKGDCRWWDVDKWKLLTEKLISKGHIIILFWASSDRSICIQHENFYNLLGKYALLDTIYAVSLVDMVVCQESGFMHFVGCTDIPMIALAWPTNPKRFYPKTVDWSWHPMGWIWRETKECYDVYGGYGRCRGDEMDGISVEEVIEKVNILL